jgi:hypothetical protein
MTSRLSIGVALCLGLFGCSTSNDEPAPDETLRLSLDAEIRDHADVTISRRAESTTVTLKLSQGWGVLPASTLLRGKGRAESFPEAAVTLYTARFALDPVTDGPCGTEPVSLALALHRRGTAERVSGSLTPYCGKDKWAGVPARTPLRLATPPVAVE